MNYWIRRRHKRQQDEIISYLKKCSPLISIGLNLYGRQTHSIQIECGSDSFWVVRRGCEWFVRLDGHRQLYQPLGDYGSSTFWTELSVIAGYYHRTVLQDLSE